MADACMYHVYMSYDGSEELKADADLVPIMLAVCCWNFAVMKLGGLTLSKNALVAGSGSL